MKILPSLVAEFIGTFTLIFVGVFAIHNANGDLLMVALAHGLAIAVMVSAFGHISGGHLNPAVTVGALVGGKIPLVDGLLYIVSQLAGATVAAFIAASIVSTEMVYAGTPVLGEGVSMGAGIALEAILTFFPVIVVFGTGIDSNGPKIGGLAIGLTVALDIMAGGPLTGAAMNTARTFGPALVSGNWNGHIVYWVGPLLGGAAAGLVYSKLMLKKAE